MVLAGDKLTLDFVVKVVMDGVVRELRMRELIRRRTVVSGCMKNGTPSCDRQLVSLAGVAAELGAAGWGVVAISRDTTGSHARMAAKHGITFPLVSDPEDQFARAAGTLVPKVLYGRRYVGPLRAAWLLEADGTVRAVIEKVDTTEHAAQLRAAIKSL